MLRFAFTSYITTLSVVFTFVFVLYDLPTASLFPFTTLSSQPVTASSASQLLKNMASAFLCSMVSDLSHASALCNLKEISVTVLLYKRRSPSRKDLVLQPLIFMLGICLGAVMLPEEHVYLVKHSRM